LLIGLLRRNPPNVVVSGVALAFRAFRADSRANPTGASVMNWYQAVFLILIVLGLRGSQAAAQAPTTVTIQSATGQRWEGLVDARSTNEQLVLRFERGGAILWRSIPWADIRSSSLAGEDVNATELRRRVPTLATPAKSRAERTKLKLLESAPADESPQPEIPLPPPKIISISCDALLVNWDADVEADGLLIYLQPLDAWQGMAPVTGMLEVELFTLQARSFHHAPYSGGRSVEPIIRWSQAVNLSDYTIRGAQIKLPFQAAHPEFDETLGAYGLVHIKFSVPGSGVFEQSMDGVRIRPWSPLRDYLQLDTGRRFLPHETTGRGKTAWPNNYP